MQNKRYSTAHYGQKKFNRSFSNHRGNRLKKDYINPSKFIKKASMTKEEVYIPDNSFEDFNLHSILKDNLKNIGFIKPSPIQDKTIPPGIEGADILGIANTGTGKTLAFALPLINRLLIDPRSKALIMAPTRELAEQIEEQIYKLTKGSRLRSVLLIGGKSMHTQLKRLSYKPRIIIGTPGRIKDHLNRGSLNIKHCNIVVLDEVDRMLDMGFVHDIKTILSEASEDRQSFYFSATLDQKVKLIIDQFANSPVHISVKSNSTSDFVDQDIVRHSAGDKLEVLHDILIQNNINKVIIFDDTQRSVEKLARELADRGFSAGSIHGGRSQSQRQRVLREFKSNGINILVATDVAARGIDVSDISHVINYSQPQTYDDYVHRIGRTGRAGKLGYALTFVDKQTLAN